MLNLVQSREFWTLVVGALVSILVAAVPQLASSKDIIIQSVMALVGVIILSFGAEKALAANASGTTKIERVTAAESASPQVKSA